MLKHSILIDITDLLPRLSTDWECSVHSYSLNLQGSSANPEVEVMRLKCNAIEFDRSLKHQHLIEVLVNTVKMQHVKTFRWKKLLLATQLISKYRLLILEITLVM